MIFPSSAGACRDSDDSTSGGGGPLSSPRIASVASDLVMPLRPKEARVSDDLKCARTAR